MAKTMPCLERSLGDKDLRGNIPPVDVKPIHLTIADPSGNGAKTPSPKQDHPEPSHVQESTSNSSSPELKRFDNILPLTERQLIKFLKHYDENVAHIDQTDKLVESTMSTIDKSSTVIKDLYQGLNVITKLLKNINNAVKDGPATNKKIDEAIKTFVKISTNTTEVISLVKYFDFSTLHSIVKDLHAHALKQEEASAAWANSSTNMAWNLGSRMTVVEISYASLKLKVFSLGQDTSKIKSMMTEIYHAFKIQSSSAPLSSVTPTLALTNIPANFKRENATNTATEEPPSYTEGETKNLKMTILISSIQPTKVLPTQAQLITTITTHPKSSQAAPRTDKGKGIATESDKDPLKKLVPSSTIIRPDPDEEEKAEKIGLDSNKITSAKAGEKFKKAQDAKHQVLKREHSKKVKRLTDLNKKRAKEYMWTMTNRIKPKPITDVKIYPNTKLVVLSVYRNNDKRNFDVHNPFKFTDFGITKLDELGPRIQKKKNFIVKDLMTSLRKIYERLKKIPEELGIQSALPTSVLEQASSQTSKRNRKHMELEPKVKVLGLECNRSPLKVGVDSIVSYLVMALVVKTKENVRFSLKLRKLIIDHPDQEKLKSKKVKLEALGY
nr:hypothetical protein [Tanacetum cinerariifolium]